MTNPWLARPGSASHRPLVEASWARARSRRLDPEHLSPPLSFSSDDLREYRRGHPLASVLPVIRRLLVRDADEDSGVLVAVGDALGRLLWIDGDQHLKSRAEGMLFVEGAAWAEPDVGTSAPGTALVLDHGVQIHGAEHFASLVHPWSCTAVPVHDPETHEILGVIDITGGADVVVPQTLPLMEATAAAVESELLVQRLRRTGRSQPRAAAARAPSLRVLGRETGLITAGGVELELSARHAEILTLLAWHRAGVSAERLALLLHGREEAVVTVRAEMVRLRKVLEPRLPRLVPLSRPYRLASPVDLDARQVLGLLDRGSHRLALEAYTSAPLPGSEAPGIRAIADELHARVRATVLTSAAADTLLAYASSPEGEDDEDAWTELLRILPRRSPRRAGVVAHLEALEAEQR